MCNVCSGEDYEVIQAATCTARRITAELQDKSLFDNIIIDAMDPEVLQAYIASEAQKDIPQEIEFRRLYCEHYYMEVNLFVLAILGLTTLDNIAQLGVQATSLTDNPQEEQHQTAKFLVTLVFIFAMSLLTCSSMRGRLQYTYYHVVAQMWQGLAHLLSYMTQHAPTPMDVDHEGPATITKVKYESVCPECHDELNLKHMAAANIPLQPGYRSVLPLQCGTRIHGLC